MLAERLRTRSVRPSDDAAHAPGGPSFVRPDATVASRAHLSEASASAEPSITSDVVESTPDRYWLRCEGCGAMYRDDGVRLDCDESHAPALLTSRYREHQLCIDGTAHGLFRYRAWLPGPSSLDDKDAPVTVTYTSEALNTAVGLSNLWIAFNGYWPERGTTFPTGTFKDLEASAVLARRSRRADGILVVASAGNTAAAFATACATRAVPCLIVLSEDRLRSLRLPSTLGDGVKLVSLTGACDYTDAIGLADRLAAVEGFVAEGGTRNVARRDGLATAVLNSVEVIGELPRHYFQAVGSGAGAIAAYEAATRLVADRRFGSRRPRLVLSQNLPFAPLVASWQRRQRELVELPDARTRVLRIKAAALSNRAPVYSAAGGLFDALTATDGAMIGITNTELARAAGLFRRSEGIDLEPEAAVAFASLLRQVEAGRIGTHELTLLNVTGAGRSKLNESGERRPPFPHLELEATDLAHPDTPARVRRLFD